MTDYWDQTPDNDIYGETETETGSTYIRVNGSNIDVEPESSFVEVVKSTAHNAGLGKFRVFLNGEEIKPMNAPEIITEGMKIELRPYDIAGER